MERQRRILPQRLISRALEVNANELAVNYNLVSESLVEEARTNSIKTIVWTVNDQAWVARASQIGVDALITNNPRKFVPARKVYAES
ncbi:MAG: glycerophosphodiester phosphodiesterase [Pyrinomonadaceae bacterium]